MLVCPLAGKSGPCMYKCVAIVLSIHSGQIGCTLVHAKMCSDHALKCIYQSVFIKVNSSKCILQSVFFKVNSSKCILQSVFFKVYSFNTINCVVP